MIKVFKEQTQQTMEVSNSELESECSNMESMSPQSRGSPMSSPSQQVSHLAHAFHGMNRPFLRILEEPAKNFRFRYKSEMAGTHGCILGQNTGPKAKTHPSVELVNWAGYAQVRVRLAQADCNLEHPHKLLADEQEDQDIIARLPERGSYRVAFPGMGIIHTAKKDVPGMLFAKLMKSANDPDDAEAGKILAHCENTARAIDLNKVRLMFSAHDPNTGREICDPVFSEVIHNMKSAATNDLKICRMSRVKGRARGGDDVYLFVEKVNKKNIMIRMFEMNGEEEVWTAPGNFMQSDVHHQYGIVFRTPPYRDPQTATDVRVSVELVRPSDGRTSEPKEFTYLADQVFKNKKRRINSSHSSIGSMSGGSLNSDLNSDIPMPVRMMAQNFEASPDVPMMYKMEIPQLPTVPPLQVQSPAADLAEALLSASGGVGAPESLLSPMLSGGRGAGAPESLLSPMLSAPAVAEPPIIQINSSEFQRLLAYDKDMSADERTKIGQSDLSEYLKLFYDRDSLNDKQQNNSMDFIRSMQLVADSGTAKLPEVKQEPEEPKECEDRGGVKYRVEKAKGGEYNAHYKAGDGEEVKKLVKEICEIIKNKEGFKKQTVCSKLERLMEIRLSNGDTFLHMTLSSNQPSFEYIVRLIHSMRMTHLLNLTNSQQQTILHLAVLSDQPAAVPMLVSRGCDPLAPDREGNSPLHYAVSCRSCLPPLLAAARRHCANLNLDIYNNEKQSPLHVAALYDAADAARLLLAAGASADCRDREGRTPLHLAVYDDHLDVTRALLEFIPVSEVDAVDGSGNTALQIVCGLPELRKNTLPILRLLLDKQADPTKRCLATPSAWQLARHEAVRSALRPHMPDRHGHTPDDRDVEVKSEPEEDFESADEGEPSSLGLYGQRVAALLAAGGWRALARRVGGERLQEACGRGGSPAQTLIRYLQESSDGFTDKSLAMHLQEIGELEAANIVMKYI